MIQQQLSSPVSLRGRLITALFGAADGEAEGMVDVLDDALPLQGASHADVIEYRIENPMRYAECMAVLHDGRKVGLRRPRQFLGWSSHSPSKSLLFRSGGKHLELVIEGRLRGRAPGALREVLLESRSKSACSFTRKFIGRDGNLVFLPILPEMRNA